MRELGGWMVMAPSPGSQVYTSLEAGPLGPPGTAGVLAGPTSPGEVPGTYPRPLGAPRHPAAGGADAPHLPGAGRLFGDRHADLRRVRAPAVGALRGDPESLRGRAARVSARHLRAGPKGQDLVPHRPRSGGASPGSAPRPAGAGPRLPGRAGPAGSPRRRPAPPVPLAPPARRPGRPSELPPPAHPRKGDPGDRPSRRGADPRRPRRLPDRLPRRALRRATSRSLRPLLLVRERRQAREALPAGPRPPGRREPAPCNDPAPGDP